MGASKTSWPIRVVPRSIALSSFTETPRSRPSPRVSTGCRRLLARPSRGCARDDRAPVGPAGRAGRGANCLPQHGCRLPARRSLRLDSDAGYLVVARSLRATPARSFGFGLDLIECVRGGSPVAFCAGIVRPTVFISEAAVAGLSDSELLAVLHHEADHARRYEPLWRAARTSAAEVLTFLPIVSWWSERQIALSELSADAAAERRVGRSSLAGALLVMTAPTIPLAAFVGHAEVRARRLLGMRIDEPKAPRAVWAASFVYSWLAVSLAGCLFAVLVALTR